MVGKNVGPDSKIMGRIPGNLKFNPSSGEEDTGGLLKHLCGLLAKQENKVIRVILDDTVLLSFLRPAKAFGCNKR